MVRVMALGLCLYFNQLFYIVGIDMSGVVVATCMQPTIPVFTAMIAVLLNLEAGSLQKFIGIALAVSGSICMVSFLIMASFGALYLSYSNLFSTLATVCSPMGCQVTCLMGSNPLRAIVGNGDRSWEASEGITQQLRGGT